MRKCTCSDASEDATLLPEAASQSPKMTFAPASWRSRTVAAPMPLAPPVHELDLLTTSKINRYRYRNFTLPVRTTTLSCRLASASDLGVNCDITRVLNRDFLRSEAQKS